MNVDETIKRFKEVLADFPLEHEGVGYDFSGRPSRMMIEPKPDVMREWKARAQSALFAALPETHSHRISWNEIEVVVAYEALQEHAGVVRAALRDLQDGYLSSVVDDVRAQTALDILDQAEALIADSPIAAMCLAGGALETHLRHLCVRLNLNPPAKGSLDVYKGVLDAARKENTPTGLTVGDSKQIVAWTDDRNMACHRPSEFTKKGKAMEVVVDGIRVFIKRTR